MTLTMMRFPSMTRVDLAVLFLAVILFVQVLSLRQFAPLKTVSSDADEVGLYVKRFDELKAALPPHGVVGYVSDDYSEPKRFMLTRYALAPLVLDERVDHPFVVGVVGNSSNVESISQANDLSVVRDFGDGIVLYRRESR